MMTVMGPLVVPEVLSYSVALVGETALDHAVVFEKRLVAVFNDVLLGKGGDFPETRPLQRIRMQPETAGYRAGCVRRCGRTSCSSATGTRSGRFRSQEGRGVGELRRAHG